MTDSTLSDPEQNQRDGPRLWGWPTFLSIVAGALILGFAATRVDFKAIWHEFAGCKKQFIVLGGFCHYATYLVRGRRWARCLSHLLGKNQKYRFGLLVFFYNFVDNLLPAKLGDVYAAHLARINCGIRRSAVMGSIVFLRMVDAWILLVSASLASWILFAEKLPHSVSWSLIGGGIIAVGATSVMLVFFLFKKSLPHWIPDKVQKMIQAFHSGMWPKSTELVPIFALTFTIWLLETSWVFCLTLAFGLRVSPIEAIFLTMIPLLASAFPFTPSGAGVVEITLFSCLRILGVCASVAGSLTLVNRFIDYWLHIGLGLMTWSVRRILGLRTWRDVPVRDAEESSPDETVLSQEVLRGN